MHLQAAAAYDAAARQIRGEAAICNFPVTEKEQQNAERYLDRVASATRKRRHTSGGDADTPALSQRRLTARQRAKLSSAGGDTGSAGGAEEPAPSGETEVWALTTVVLFSRTLGWPPACLLVLLCSSVLGRHFELLELLKIR